MYDSIKLIEMANNAYLSRLKVLNMTRTNQGVIEEIEDFLSFLESIKKEFLKEREEDKLGIDMDKYNKEDLTKIDIQREINRRSSNEIRKGMI